MQPSFGYAAISAGKPLVPFHFERREPGPHDVQIEILFCGVCHSDLQAVRNEWGSTIYPLVPGHEIVGRVSRVGAQVTQFEVGQLAGVGCMVDSCRHCSSCMEGLEQYCENGLIGTYNGYDKHTGKTTLGGYANNIVVNDKFVLHISDQLDLAATAPLLCAGITTYSALRHWKVGPGQKVGIVGLGGLGHMGVKLAHAMGAHVVLFTTSLDKKEDALRLGADGVVIFSNTDEMAAQKNSLDFILNTVAMPHNLEAFMVLLKREGTMTLVGVPGSPHPALYVTNLLFKRRHLAGSLIGGIAETQEMLDFCAEHRITSDIELIPIQKIDAAYQRMLKSDVKYCFVIDMTSLKTTDAAS